MIYATEDGCAPRLNPGNAKMQVFAYWQGILQSSYTQKINKMKQRTGSLFQIQTKAKELNKERYFIKCMDYIHRNPLKAGLVKKMEEWPYSSFSDYAGLRDGNLCNQQLFFDLSGYTKESFLKGGYESNDYEGLY